MSDKGNQTSNLVSDAQILEIIRASFGNNAEITGCQRILSGLNNMLYDIKTSSPEQHIVLRIAPGDDMPFRNYEHERKIMLAEPFKYDLMRKAGIPAVKVLVADGSRSVIDREYLIVEFLDAVPMNHQSVPAEACPHIMREVGRLTALMHSITADKFGWIMPDGSIRGSTSWAEVFGELLTEAFTKWRDAGIIENSEAEAALDNYWSYRSVFDECCTPSFTHNDIWDPNIMVKEENGEWNVKAILDVDEAVFADHEFEYMLWQRTDEDFLLGYGRQVDSSPHAVLRHKFYQMHLNMQYSWFYLVHAVDAGFQEHTKRVALDIMQEVGRQ